jgi:hypothetical protein
VLPEYRELPTGFNPRTLQLALQTCGATRATANADTPALVQGVMDRLRTGGYTYTLTPGVYGQHTADEFWFDRKAGFCEHIASSFVILMRALDVPARIVTGYQGGERNNVDGFWTIRQADAHAWAEVWMPGSGWTRVDPTSAVAPGRTGAFERLRAPQGAVAAALWRGEPHAGRQPARRLGGREQPLEPVGAELHPEQTAGPAEKHRLHLPQLGRPGYVLLGLIVGQWRCAARCGRCGSAAATTPGCACCSARSAACSKPAPWCPPAPRRARLAAVALREIWRRGAGRGRLAVAPGSTPLRTPSAGQPR